MVKRDKMGISSEKKKLKAIEKMGSRPKKVRDLGGVGKKIWIVCHDSSIRTSIVRERERERGVCVCACACARARVRVSLIGSPPSSPAIISLPSACARTYNASRAFSSAIRFARERSASVSCAREKK